MVITLFHPIYCVLSLLWTQGLQILKVLKESLEIFEVSSLKSFSVGNLNSTPTIGNSGISRDPYSNFRSVSSSGKSLHFWAGICFPECSFRHAFSKSSKVIGTPVYSVLLLDLEHKDELPLFSDLHPLVVFI